MTAPTAVDAITVHTCLRCGYELRGLEHCRCPECGLAFDPTSPPPPAVPWLRRKHIGLLHAYAGTIWLVVGQPKLFAAQAWRWTDFDPRESERFRRVTVVIAAVSIAITVALSQFFETDATPVGYRAALATQSSLIALTASLAFFGIATLRIPIPMPHVRAEGAERRMKYLQNFCCAALGLSPLIALAAVLVVLVRLMHLFNDAWPVVVVFLAIPAVLGTWCLSCAAFLTIAGRVGLLRWIQCALLSVLLWALAIFAAMVVFLATAAVLAPIFPRN
jgi:hypothetical protein